MIEPGFTSRKPDNAKQFITGDILGLRTEPWVMEAQEETGGTKANSEKGKGRARGCLSFSNREAPYPGEDIRNIKTMRSSPSKISQNFSFIMDTPDFFQLQLLIAAVAYISKVFIKFRETTNLNDFFAIWFLAAHISDFDSPPPPTRGPSTTGLPPIGGQSLILPLNVTRSGESASGQGSISRSCFSTLL